MRNTKQIDKMMSPGLQSDTGVKRGRSKNTAAKAEAVLDTAVAPNPDRVKGPAKRPWGSKGLVCYKCGNRIRKRPFVMTERGPTHRVCPLPLSKE